LAEELQAALLLIDDRVRAQVALSRGLTITGTLGVLVEAAQGGLIQIEVSLRKLRETNFRATPGLYERVAGDGTSTTSGPPAPDKRVSSRQPTRFPF